jgi:hypothetical protein
MVECPQYHSLVHTILINGAGTGKTRLALEGLSFPMALLCLARSVCCTLMARKSCILLDPPRRSENRPRPSFSIPAECAWKCTGRVHYQAARLLVLKPTVFHMRVATQQCLWLLQLLPAQCIGRDIFPVVFEIVQNIPEPNLSRMLEEVWNAITGVLDDQQFFVVLDDPRVSIPSFRVSFSRKLEGGTTHNLSRTPSVDGTLSRFPVLGELS